MKLIRTLSVFLTIVSIALTWLFLPAIRTAALLLRALGGHLGAQLLLPGRILQPGMTVMMVTLASAGTLFLIAIQILKLRMEVRLLLLAAYICVLAICILIGFVVSTLQIHTLFLAHPVPGINF